MGILLLFSQLGGKVAARSSPAWILLFAFLLFCVISPQSLEPVAHFFGIQLVSNFVLSALIFFLIFQAIQESVFNTKHGRKLRELTSFIASQNYQGTKKNSALVILPAFNEESNIEMMIAKMKSLPGLDYCFINDGSSDNTESILKKNQASYVSHPTNIGVSGALLTGLKIAKQHGYEYMIQCDSDGQHPVEKIPELIKKASETGSDLIIGSRFLDSSYSKDESSTPLRRFGSFVIRASLKLFSSRASLTDPTSGFRIYSQQSFSSLIHEMPEEYPEPEILAQLLLKKKKVLEIPVVMNPRQGGESSISGLKSIHFMMKVLSALVGLRLRNL